MRSRKLILKILAGLLFTTFIIILTACGGQAPNRILANYDGPATAQVEILRNYHIKNQGQVTVFYDQQGDVTCWAITEGHSSGGWGNGLSCLSGKR